MTKADLHDIRQRMAHFEHLCRNSGVKLTHQRLEIFRELVATNEHPDAEKVYQGVRKRMPTVSLDTVYRTLWLLNDLGLITTLGPAREKTRFDANMSRHHHYVCTRCGMMEDFYSDELNELTLPESVKAFGNTEETHVEVRGVCVKCASKEQNIQQKLSTQT